MDFQHAPYWQAAIGLPIQVFAGQTFAMVDKDQEIDVQGEIFGQQNFGLHVGDDAQVVQQKRMQLLQRLQPFGATRLQWLNQTHSTTAYIVDAVPNVQLQDGDGLVTQQQGVALMMMTADCLPIVMSNANGTEVACLHAGWRGLAQGIIEATIAKMQTQPIYAWMGAAISQAHFEVGAEVRAEFVAQNYDFSENFIARDNGKFLADLYGIARKKLQALGVVSITGGDRCSFAEAEQFYSYRRQAKTGRMATFVFIAEKDARLTQMTEFV